MGLRSAQVGSVGLPIFKLLGGLISGATDLALWTRTKRKPKFDNLSRIGYTRLDRRQSGKHARQSEAEGLQRRARCPSADLYPMARGWADATLREQDRQEPVVQVPLASPSQHQCRRRQGQATWFRVLSWRRLRRDQNAGLDSLRILHPARNRACDPGLPVPAIDHARPR